jgi:hypothetical protein
MPFVIVKVQGGFKVKKNVPGPPTYYSKHPLTHEMALRQLKALLIHVRH